MAALRPASRCVAELDKLKCSGWGLVRKQANSNPAWWRERRARHNLAAAARKVGRAETMSLFGWIFSRKNRLDDYTEELREAVRKWLNRFFKGEDVQDDFWSRVRQYKTRNKSEPKVNDIIWGMLNDRRAFFFKEGMLGLYRNDTLAMCMLLDIENRQDGRFVHAIHLTTLDACGASNVPWGTSGGGPLRLNEAYIAPVCLPLLAECSRYLELNFEQVRDRFIQVAEELLASFGKYRPKLSGIEIWGRIQHEIRPLLEQEPHQRSRRRISEPVLIQCQR